MIINLSKHDIIGRSKNTLSSTNNIEVLGLKEMPLSYINTQDTERNPKVIIYEEYLESSKKRVIPYSSFSSDDIYLFNDKNEILENIDFKRVGAEYFYEVKGQTEYNPLRYDVHLEIKKNLEYKNNKIFNINVCTIEKKDAETPLANKLITAFADKYIYGDCPSNIIINDGNRSVESMSRAFNECNFVFLESDEGKVAEDIENRTKDEETGEKMTLDELLDNHINVWAFCKEYENRLIKDSVSSNSDYEINHSKNILYDSNKYYIHRSQLNIFDKEKGFVEVESGQYYYEYLNEATLIIHKQGKGYLIITPDWYINDIRETYKMFYETLIYIHMNSYLRSKSLNMWITDEPVDYLAYHNKKYGRCHNIITLNDLLIGTGISPDDSYSIIDVKVSSPDVSFIGVNNNNELMFFKTGGEANPLKKNNEVSYYTTKHSIINYHEEEVYMIETPIETELTSTESGLYLTIKPVYSTSKRLRVDEEQTFKITNFATQYSIFVDSGTKFISNTFYVVPRTEIPKSGWKLIGTVSFSLSKNTTANDTRIMGGGLPEDQKDDFDMLDIGHIYGRPYRLGSTYIIKLPKKVSNFDKRVRKELDKHIAAGDEYIIHYNKE